MYYVVNVIKYLAGDGYDPKTLHDDIAKTFDAIKTKSHNNLFQALYDKFAYYSEIKREEIFAFANTIMQEGYPEEYQKILQYYYLPFRTSRDPIADKMIYENMFKINNLTIEKVIMGNLVGSPYSCNQVFIDRLNKFIEEEQISFESIKSGSKLERNRVIPSPQDIAMQYEWYKQVKNTPDALAIVNNYGELMFYQYLQTNLTSNDRLLWISRDLGDGFGYDIAVYKSTENKLYMYKVKTTAEPSKFESVVLSESENRINNETNNNSQEDYHVVRICVEEPYQMVDIDNKTLSAKDLYQPTKERLLINNNRDLRIV